MDLRLNYLNLNLEHPLLLGSSPLSADLDAVRRAEDDGAAGIVMHSLFEEQLTNGQHSLSQPPFSSPPPRADYYVPQRSDFKLNPDEYLEQIRRIKAAVSIPVIGSINGTRPGPWLEFARSIDQAGADALELSLYRIGVDASRDAESVEAETVGIVHQVRASTALPVAVKLAPFYTSLPHVAGRLVNAGVHGFVLFHRFYQPDIDLERMEVRHQIELSTPAKLSLRLRWIAILSAELRAAFSASGGVHSALDALKAVSVGAQSVQLVSEVLQRGTRRFGEIRREMTEWLEQHQYNSLEHLHRRMNLSNCVDSTSYERVNYIHMLNSWA